DLVLFSESISDRHRDRVVDHLKSVSRNGTPPTLSIPALRNGDRATFVSQIGKSLGKANGTPRAPPAAAAKAPASAPPPVPSGKRDFFATAVEAPKTHDIDPVELELLSQASALETAPVHETEELVTGDQTFEAFTTPVATVSNATRSIDPIVDEPALDPIAAAISAYTEPDTTPEIDEDHESDLHIPIDDLARTRRSGDQDRPALDPIAAAISAYTEPDTTPEIDEDHESDLHIPIDDLARTRRSGD